MVRPVSNNNRRTTAALLVILAAQPQMLFAQQPGVLGKVEKSNAAPQSEQTSARGPATFWNLYGAYGTPGASPLPLNPAERARSLVHNGALYLSLYDALALAIENNLDVEVGRYQLSIAGTDIKRAKGGGTVRGLDYSVSESPTGVGGPGSPLLNSAAASVSPTTPTVNDLTSLNELTQTQTNLSVQGATPYSPGPSIPVFDPSLVGQATWFQRSNTTSLTGATLGSGAGSTIAVGTPSTLNFTTTNLAYVQGFSPGTQLQVEENNAAQVLYGNTGYWNPFSAPNTSVTITQPLFRSFGREVNLRFLKVANLNQRASRLIFYQQLISTVYGVARLYFDLVSLNENVRVQQESLAAAVKLRSDDAAQVEQGTLAPLELTRAQSLVTSSQLNVIQAQGLVHQQEVILKTQLSKKGTADPIFGSLPIMPTDPIVVPPNDELPSLNALVSEAMATRPDLAQASLEVQAGETQLRGSQNEARPEIDVIANFQTRGSAEIPFATLGSPGTGLITSPVDLSQAGLRTSRVYQAGIEVNLPLRNRVAQADAARDLLQLRQSQARTQRLANEVREDVENSLIALQTARSALDAAIQSREYQEQLVSAEKDRLTVGTSTNFLVVQQQSYLAQARSTEVAARSVWIKARVALDRSIGDLLEKNGISYEESVVGKLQERR